MFARTPQEAIAFITVDQLKQTVGHQAGSRVLHVAPYHFCPASHFCLLPLVLA